MNSEIYQPAEDSYLLKETLEKYLNKIKDKHIKILDMGSGSGIQAKTCKKFGFDNVLAADINKKAVKELKKQSFNAIESDLFSNIKEKFNLIIFNPPYLPEDKYDKKPDTTAGKQGYELIIKFLKQAKQHLNKKGVILFLFSSLSRQKIILKTVGQLNYKMELLNKKKIFFETLFVYEIAK